MSKKKIKWGILGTGEISNQFALALNDLPQTKLTAIGSRSISSAKLFANKYNIPKYYGCYEDLVDDPDIDVVYIGTLNQVHMDNTLLCLNAGKAVLCEKPFAINSNQLKEILTIAKNKKVFLMEAMRTRFLPHILKLRELLKENHLGKIQLLQLNFGFSKNRVLNRLFKPEFGGGALMDMGVYGISLSSMLFGRPLHIKSIGNISNTGVDEDTILMLKHQNGELTQIACSISTDLPLFGMITGTKGIIKMEPKWWRESNLIILLNNKKQQIINFDNTYNFHSHIIMEVNQCVRKNTLQSEKMTLDESLEILKTLDIIRSQLGLKYPIV